MSSLLLAALAIALILEGLGPLLFPNAWGKYFQQLSTLEPSQMRRIGGVLVTIGAISLYYFIGI
jgi:uncharacterized protein YjeT (DUF2065 family)